MRANDPWADELWPAANTVLKAVAKELREELGVPCDEQITGPPLLADAVAIIKTMHIGANDTGEQARARILATLEGIKSC